METIHKFIVLIVLSLSINSIHSLHDITSQTISGNQSGIFAAFGDFNSDKWTDVFVLDEDANRIKVYLGNGLNQPYLTESAIFINTTGKTVLSVAASDLDGDSNIDVVLSFKKSTDGVQVEIYGGDNQNFSKPFLLNWTLKDQPLVMDYNMDMKADIFGETLEGKRYFWSWSGSNVTTHEVTNNASLHYPSSMGFVDLFEDISAGLFLRMDPSSFHYYLIKNDQLDSNFTEFPVSKDLVAIGEPTFVDLDSDGYLDVLLPACNESSCLFSGVYVLADNKSTLVSAPFLIDGVGFKFQISDTRFPASFRVADFDLDGYPDIVVPLVPSSVDPNKPKDPVVAILRNVRCGSASHCSRGRSFELSEYYTIPGAKTQIVPAFFDVGEDGIMELLVSYTTENRTRMLVLNNDATKGSCFLKVLVLSGLCNGKSCSNGVLPYGSNVPGPVIEMATTSMSGDEFHSKAAQMSQSAYFALQLPYTIFGLGKTPNFVDTLGIKVQNVSTLRHHQWTSLIPNSQLVVNPYPLDYPDSWVAKLFITPSRLVILTAIALGSTCVFIIILIGLLHWRERRLDEKEKRELANRFHFDAM